LYALIIFHYFVITFLHFNSPFTGKSGLTSYPQFSSSNSIWRERGNLWHMFLWALCSSCHLASSVNVLKETRITDLSQWFGFVFSSSTDRLLMDGTMLPLHWLCRQYRHRVNLLLTQLSLASLRGRSVEYQL